MICSPLISIFQTTYSIIWIIKIMSNHKGIDVYTSSHDLLCFLCQDLLCRPTTTSCGHTFCYMCLDQYFLYSDICPKCSKCIRGKCLNPVPCLTQFIQNMIRDDREEYQLLVQRNKVAKQYFKKRELRGIKVGMVLDVRDGNSIWCQGMVVRVITRLEEPVRLLRISYLNYLQQKEEDIEMNSERLAPKGFFTTRKDIPHYGTKNISPIITKYQF